MKLKELTSILTYLELILPILIAFPDSNIDINPNPVETLCDVTWADSCQGCLFKDLNDCSADSPENVKAMIKIVKQEIRNLVKE